MFAVFFFLLSFSRSRNPEVRVPSLERFWYGSYSVAEFPGGAVVRVRGYDARHAMAGYMLPCSLPRAWGSCIHGALGDWCLGMSYPSERD